MVRLKQKEIKIIKETISSFIDNFDVFVFGSRLDNSKKGGDIDLYINQNISYELKIKIKSKLQYLLNKPVDLVVHKDFNRDIEKEAIKWGVKL